jgi:hypothetical protein
MLFLSYPSASLQRYCQVSTFQHNVRVLPCAFFCFRRLPALLLSSIVHALINSLRLPTLPLTEVFPLFPVALSALISVTHCCLPLKNISVPYRSPAPTPKLSTQSCVTVEIPLLHYLHVSDTRCILLNSQCPILARQ